MNAITKIGDYIKSRCIKTEEHKSDESSDEKSDQTPLATNMKKRPQMDNQEHPKEQPMKKLKLSKTSAKKPTIIDLTQDTEDETTPLKVASKKDPVIKIEFPPGSMVKLKAKLIRNKRNRYDEIDDFYAVVADPDKELPVHLHLPADKACVYIGVAGFKEWVDKTRQNVITKIVNNSDLTMIFRAGQTLQGVPMELTEKMSKQFIWTKEGWVMRAPRYLCHGCGDADCILFNHNASSMDIIEHVKDEGGYRSNKQARYLCYQRCIQERFPELRDGERRPTGHCFEEAVHNVFPSDSYTGYRAAKKKKTSR
jgi:hypothetical protein